MKKSEADLIKAEIAALEAGEPVHVDGPYDNVFEALYPDDPEIAANLTMRSDLMGAIETAVAAWGLSQVKAAKRLGVKQPRLNALIKGHIDQFSLDALVQLAVAAGLRPQLVLDPQPQPEMEPA